MLEEKTRIEEFQLNGDMLVAKVKEVVHGGKIRRIVIKTDEGKTLVDIPLTMGVLGALLLPQLAALGAIAAMVGRCTLIVERADE
ncbi:MAG: DUF4342 domain-containing protein [Candidatus Eisenbacteria bacterium]|jgi:hypothetical protein|nr:DUF4342 domain-containing protein [Candidatus Eisenbacteria bacterium]